MPKPDPARLIEAAYPLRRTMQTRVSDIDGYGHLNAIRIAQLYEDARAAFYREAGAMSVRTVVAQLTLRYLEEGFWPEDVRIGTGVVRIGNSSFEMGQALFQGARCIGLADTIIVHTDGPAAAPLPAPYRDRLEAMMIRAPEMPIPA